jgi:uroporphyrinogen decarboxylase
MGLSPSERKVDTKFSAGPRAETIMTPRERVLSALNHQQPDKTPIDFSGHRSSGIAAIAYPKLRKTLGLEPRPIRVYDPVQQLAVVDGDVLDRFGVDTIELGRGFAQEEQDWSDWTLPDGTPCKMPAWALPERQEGQWVLRSGSGRVLAKMPDGAIYFEQCYWPFLDEDDFERLPEALAENMWCGVASPPGPLVGGPDGTRALTEGAKRLRSRTDRAIIGLFGGNLLETGQWLYRMDRFLMRLAGESRRTHEFLDRLVEIHLGNLERYLGAVGPYIDVIAFGDDLGMQNGPQMSRAMYQEFFKPRHAKMWRRAKELAEVKVMLHCCGGVRPLLPDLIEAGLDAINPVQISCAGMEAAGLKKDFGDRIAFWGGGCDTRFVLSHGTPDAVRRHVREQVSVLSPGGGFVFQQVHNILADVPPENIIAMFDAVHAMD